MASNKTPTIASEVRATIKQYPIGTLVEFLTANGNREKGIVTAPAYFDDNIGQIKVPLTRIIDGEFSPISPSRDRIICSQKPRNF